MDEKSGDRNSRDQNFGSRDFWANKFRDKSQRIRQEIRTWRNHGDMQMGSKSSRKVSSEDAIEGRRARAIRVRGIRVQNINPRV